MTDQLPFKLLARGKVRDIYEVDAHSLLFVATDRLSAFDVVMKTVQNQWPLLLSSFLIIIIYDVRDYTSGLRRL